MSVHDIAHVQEGANRPWETRFEDGQVLTHSNPGAVLTMTNGERWFHPYKGGAPERLEDRKDG